jgi:hypothetical protein
MVKFSLGTYVAGNVVVTHFEARGAQIEKAGVHRIILWGIREMKGDKIASSRCCLPDRTDSQTGCIGYGYPGRGGGHYYYHHHDWR